MKASVHALQHGGVNPASLYASQRRVRAGDAELGDVRIAATIDPQKEGTEKLLGGDWARFVARDFDSVSKIFQTLGMNDLAQ